MIRNALLVVSVLAVAGCYTQFATVRRPANEGTIPDSLWQNDSTHSRVPDTIVVKDNQVCYWERDAFGQPALKCYDSNYGNDWYRYNNYPWWYSSDPYFYGRYDYYGFDHRCPTYYYWDNSCSACRYYRDYPDASRSWWWDTPGSGSSSSKSSRPRHSRTTGVPTSSQVGNGASGQSPKKAEGSSAAGTTAGTGTGSGVILVPEHKRHTRTEGVPAANEVQQAPKTESPPVNQLGKEQAPQAPQPAPQSATESSASPQATEPAASPQATEPAPQDKQNQDNPPGTTQDNGKRRHTTRGW